MTGFGLILGLFGQALAPVPPPMVQDTANCAAPVYATDRLVCGDAALRSLDDALRQRLTTATLPESPWMEDQAAWFRRRSLCAFDERHRACALAAYRDRIDVLDALAETPAPRTRARCAKSGITGFSRNAYGVTFYDQAGMPVALASSAGASGSWRPFTTVSAGRTQLTLRTITGEQTVCTIVSRSQFEGREPAVSRLETAR